jgi:hypothetical protein
MSYNIAQNRIKPAVSLVADYGSCATALTVTFFGNDRVVHTRVSGIPIFLQPKIVETPVTPHLKTCNAGDEPKRLHP